MEKDKKHKINNFQCTKKLDNFIFPQKKPQERLVAKIGLDNNMQKKVWGFFFYVNNFLPVDAADMTMTRIMKYVEANVETFNFE